MIDCVVSIIISSLSDWRPDLFACSRASKTSASALTCSGIVIFGRVTTKLSGSLPPDFSAKRGNENIEGAHAARAQLFVKRLDANANKGRQRTVSHAVGDFRGRSGGMAIFFCIGTIAVAVFKVDAKIFDRFAPQFFVNAVVNGVGQPHRFVFLPNDVGVVFQSARKPSLSSVDSVVARRRAVRALSRNNEVGSKLIERATRQRAQAQAESDLKRCAPP